MTIDLFNLVHSYFCRRATLAGFNAQSSEVWPPTRMFNWSGWRPLNRRNTFLSSCARSTHRVLKCTVSNDRHESYFQDHCPRADLMRDQQKTTTQRWTRLLFHQFFGTLPEIYCCKSFRLNLPIFPRFSRPRTPKNCPWIPNRENPVRRELPLIDTCWTPGQLH